MSKSSYYYTVKVLEKDDEDIEIKERISTIYNENKGRYGYRRITLVLKNQGETINHKRVKRLMKVLGLFGVTPKAKYKSYKGDMNGTCKNLLLDKKVDEVNHKTTYERNFKTTGCNQKWATDVSEFHISSGKLYLSPIIDIHNGEIVSFDIEGMGKSKARSDQLCRGLCCSWVQPSPNVSNGQWKRRNENVRRLFQG